MVCTKKTKKKPWSPFAKLLSCRDVKRFLGRMWGTSLKPSLTNCSGFTPFMISFLFHPCFYHSFRATTSWPPTTSPRSPNLVAFGGGRWGWWKWNEVRQTKQSDNTVLTKKEKSRKTLYMLSNVVQYYEGGAKRLKLWIRYRTKYYKSGWVMTPWQI